jgi:2-C-methyl-D-erythritol 4-phosphate cytidylyltransferase
MKMANIALILAGGTGTRMKQDIPKQFMQVLGKPVIIYTLEAFQRHPEIEAVIVVCLDGWQDFLATSAKQYGITKLCKIVRGGENGQESICNGVNACAQEFALSDIILIHDAIRPMVTEDIITENIGMCQKLGNAVTVIPCMEAMLKSDDFLHSDTVILRDSLFRAQTPQTISVSRALELHKEAKRNQIYNSVATCTLLIELGEKVNFVNGSELNIKITKRSDVILMKALLTVQSNNEKG